MFIGTSCILVSFFCLDKYAPNSRSVSDCETPEDCLEPDETLIITVPTESANKRYILPKLKGKKYT